MKSIKLTNNLSLHEYIPRELYTKYEGREHILIGLLDKRLVEADQLLRKRFGAVTINDWWWGGTRNWSGLRTADSSYFSPTSQHSFGRASDKLFKNVTAEEVIEDIKINHLTYGITGLEEMVNWVHTDVRWSISGLLITFKK